MQTDYIEFDSNWYRNMYITGRISFNLSIKYEGHWTDFHATHACSRISFSKQPKSTFMKVWQTVQSLLRRHNQRDTWSSHEAFRISAQMTPETDTAQCNKRCYFINVICVEYETRTQNMSTCCRLSDLPSNISSALRQSSKCWGLIDCCLRQLVRYCRGSPCVEEIARFLSKEAVATSIQEERETPCREKRNDSRSIVDAWDLWSIGRLDVPSDFQIRINLGYCQFMLHFFVYRSHTSYVSMFKDLVLYVCVEYLTMLSLLHNSIGKIVLCQLSLVTGR